MVSHITEIGVEPNSTIAHGRYLGRTLNSAGPADCPVLLRRRLERRATQDLVAWHRRARQAARGEGAPRGGRSFYPPGRAERKEKRAPAHSGRGTPRQNQKKKKTHTKTRAPPT